MALLLQVPVFVRTVHLASLLVLVFLGLVLADGHVQHVDPGEALLCRVAVELENPVDDHQVKPKLLVALLINRNISKQTDTQEKEKRNMFILKL